MGYKRDMLRSAFCAALAAVTGPASGEPREPLVVTNLANPASGTIAASEPWLKVTRLNGDDQDLALDQAVANFGRAIGEAAHADRQALDAKCRSSQGQAASVADRFTWAVNCQYSRR